ncbi:sugar phosphate nucleotidyltransferase [Mangrovibacillus sp. Mu-81]|jgi:NDP-sugar pyrophosphorylase family protein|uniref:nucleotidyltransferase family protein n=1 Tax=Mangrovibacillus sp. Mu-81 TaxID=3121478 RepID=UPI002FE4CCF7
MKAVILAGGEGKRLRPYTISVAKPMVPILNKPILEYSINLLSSYGIKDILITTCYKSNTIKEYFGNGSRFHVNIRYLEERKPLGTAGGIFLAKNLLEEPFLVLSGDAFTNIPIDQVIQFHTSKNAAMTLVSKEVPNPGEYGICYTDLSRKLVDFIEKPATWERNEVNTGVYIVEPFLLKKYSRKGAIDFSQDLIPSLLNNNEPVYVYKTNAYWRDIGNPEEYKKARDDLMRGQFTPGKALPNSRNQGVPIPDPFITRVQVACPKVKKPFVLAKLLETVPSMDEEEFMIEHRDGGWTKIVSDPDRGFIIYSKADRRNLARELARYYGKKIKTWQKV